MELIFFILIIIMFIAPFLVEDNTRNKSTKIYIFIMLSVSIIVALLMTACGFTFTAVELLSKADDGLGPLIYIIAIPSIIIGSTFLWLSIRKIINLFKKHNK